MSAPCPLPLSVPTCCGQNYDRAFNARTAARELRRYRRRGPRGATGRLLRSIVTRLPTDSPSVLDIGGGVGVLQHELAGAGAREVTAVDASGHYLQVLGSEVRRLGYGDRHRAHEGDIVSIAAELDEADIVTLDKVICCYPNMRELVEASAQKSKALYGIVVPMDGVVLRAGFLVLNRFLRLFRCDFQVFLHPHQGIDAVLQDAGFGLVHQESAFPWAVRLYARA